MALPRPHKATALVPSRLSVVGIVVGITVGPARHRSRSGEAGGMSCSIGIMDNDWFAFLSQQLLLPKTACQSATKTADKKDGGQAYTFDKMVIKLP